jgi:tetratricopeptide (TPR) repeat protein
MTSAGPAPTLAAARAALDAVRLHEARRIAQALLDAPPADPQAAVDARRIVCNAAFRLGDLPQAVVASRELQDHVGASSAHPARFDALAILVVAHGEQAEYDASIEAVRALLSLAGRGDSLADYVRARGSLAVCLTLLGDPWAGQRVHDEVAALLGKLPDELRLEAAVHTNRASIVLHIARLAGEGGDAAAQAEAIAAAQISLDRGRAIATTLADPRLQAFVDVHECEALLLRGEGQRVLDVVRAALTSADVAGLSAHGRYLRQLEAEALLRERQPEAALRCLRAAEARLGTGHDYTSRIRQLTLLHEACAALGDYPQALVHFEQACELKHRRGYRQAQAQSRHLRLRLELEHLGRRAPPA